LLNTVTLMKFGDLGTASEFAGGKSSVSEYIYLRIRRLSPRSPNFISQNPHTTLTEFVPADGIGYASCPTVMRYLFRADCSWSFWG
jgi:hypothetical protein